MDGTAHHGRRARPVADAPAPDPEGLAKGWLLALVADAPLARAGSVPAAELARGGPAVCAGVVAALASDAELERLVGGEGRAAPAASVARLTGARSPAALAAAVEALRAVTWRALRGGLHDADPLLVSDLSDRLAHVCARVAAVALAAPAIDPPGRAGPLADVLASAGAAPPAPPPAEPAEPAAPAEGAAAPPQGVHPIDLPPVADRDPLTTLAEELAAAPPGGVAGAMPDIGQSGAPDAPTVMRMRPVDTSWDAVAASGPPWLAAIARRLERRRQDSLPFAVLVVEVDDLDRLLAAQPGREIAVALEAAERGLTAELAPADLVVRERLGRWWLTSPDRDAAGARDLGLRVAAAIAHATRTHPPVPMAASIGVAVCPDDGDGLEALAGRADEGMFAARAAGVPLA
jgi:GGDEF domain-containing protein